MDINTSINKHNNKPQKEDLSGRDRIVSNVIFNWASYFVFIVAGFIMPRMIDNHLGIDILGIWDFTWSLTAYFNLVQFGISSSINRYIAKYRASGNTNGINFIISTSSFLLGIAGLIIIGLTVTFCLLLPLLFRAKLGDNTNMAQWVLFFIGTSIALQIAFGPFSGLLTGFHRWGLHNSIKSFSYLLIVVFMIIMLFLGKGLRSLAIVTLIGYALECIARVIFAYRTFEGLQVRAKYISKEIIKKQFLFGGKTLIPSISNLLLNQTTSILILAYLGPAALAIYSRPRSLVNHINTLVSKMSMTLVPTISSLQSNNNFNEIRDLLISSVRYALYLVLPIILVLIIFGDAIMQIWMGADYVNRLLISILALGYMACMAQKPALNILGGLNSHGRAGMALFIVSIFSVGLTFFTLGYLGLGISGAAAAVILPLTIVNLIYIPVLVCRRTGLNLKRYFLSTTSGPIIHVLPFAFCLITAKFIFVNNIFKGLLIGAGTGSLILAILYYKYVLPKRIKMRLFRYKTIAS